MTKSRPSISGGREHSGISRSLRTSSSTGGPAAKRRREDPRIHSVYLDRRARRSRILDRGNALMSRHGSSGLRRVATLLAPPVDDEETGVPAKCFTDTETKLVFGQVLVSRESFPDAELPEDHVQHVLDIDGAHDPTQAIRRQPQLLGAQLLASGVAIDRSNQVAIRIAEQFDMAQA